MAKPDLVKTMSAPSRRSVISSLPIAFAPPLLAFKGARTFYVSADGNDRYDGLSKSRPWRTSARVASGELLPGDQVKFRCGDTFYGPVRIRARRLIANAPCVIGAYGDRTRGRPKISCYKIIDRTAWVRQGEGVWRADLNDLRCVSGNINTLGPDGANIGFLRIDGVIKARKLSSAEELREEWDFYSDNSKFLYVKCSAKPSNLALEVLAAPKVDALRSSSGVQYRDLEITGAGGHGVQWAWNRHVDMQFCHIHEIGGSYLTGTTRYGNGVECWTNCYNINISNCVFGDIYDAATTTQGYGLNASTNGWKDITISNNVAYRCSQAFEAWSRYGPSFGEGVCPPGSGFRNVRATGWILYDLGRGAFANVRRTRAEVAPFLLYRMEAPGADITVSVSAMSNCEDRLLAVLGMQRVPAGFSISPSVVTLRSNQKIMTGFAHTGSEWDQWVTDSGFANGSRIIIDDYPSMTELSIILERHPHVMMGA